VKTNVSFGSKRRHKPRFSEILPPDWVSGPHKVANAPEGQWSEISQSPKQKTELINQAKEDGYGDLGTAGRINISGQQA
jgi:hypothetical protein